MRNLLSTSGSGPFLRLSIVALVAGGAAACSSDASRFNDPNSNPFSAQSAPSYTGSVAAAPTGAVQGGAISSAPIAPPAGQAVAGAYPGPYGTPSPYGAPAAGAAPYGAPRQLASATPTYTPPAPQPSYGGTQPLYGTQPQPLAATAPARPAPQVAAASSGAHVVAPGETLSSIARNYGVTRSALASANGLDFNAQVRTGQKLVMPVAGGPATPAPVVAAAPKPAPAPVLAAAKPVTAPTPVATAPAAAAAKPQTIAAVKPSETPDDIRAEASGPQFRWPVRGRVISGFGPKPGGQQNEGINISVPEGTSVKAAEDGVVAYAGSELKGYGNLVLIKHADGWVTAYANNSALDVKKGDTVKRGQVIAKAGQTGNVTSPQLHFEIRKGSQPVDPSQYLAGL
ncbi:M23 family metallopeptidase [Ancylobacter sp. TS-1]|uniref:M23 family metallopeptidase n=1 Tax=Ancylobacter sp. TS-1 TaxID=1850374 RepID=UPI001265CC17|nr:M23 family metallopeptidase [Ancylobacter sp. TS-1]QFR32528.1 peptidoglycan DD-metalloendopeptidase family protein [Ancylobacter sp. TS-1]